VDGRPINAHDRVYDRDYVDLPPVETGDRVRVAYVSNQTNSTQERAGEVVEIHANGFTFVHDSGDEKLATSVRDHEDHITDRPIQRRIVTVKKRDGRYVHATELNRNHEAPMETTVEVVED
jgi:hypothetical protein